VTATGVARQVHGDETGPRSSWEVKSAGQGQGPAPDQRSVAQRSGLPGIGCCSSGKGKALECQPTSRSHGVGRNAGRGFPMAPGWLGASPHISSGKGVALCCAVCKLAPSPSSQTSRRGGCTQGLYMGFLQVEFTWMAD